MSAMASPHDVDPAVGAHMLPRAQDLLRSDSGQDEHDPQLVLQARVDRRSPDDPGVRGDSTLDDLGDLLRLGHAHVVPAGHVHEAPVAALMSTSIKGELIASSIASSERL